MSNPFELEQDFFSVTSKNGFASSTKILSDENELMLEELTPQINRFFHHRELQNNLKISGTITCDNIIAKNLSTIDQETGNITNNITVNSVENSAQIFSADQGRFTSLDSTTLTTQNLNVNGSLDMTESQRDKIVENTSSTVEFKGNAATATKLANSVNVGGVSFDGGTDINLPGVNIPGTQDTTGNAATATKLANSVNVGGVSFDGGTDINLPGVNVPGTQDTTGNAESASSAKAASALANQLTQIQNDINDLKARVMALENNP